MSNAAEASDLRETLSHLQQIRGLEREACIGDAGHDHAFLRALTKTMEVLQARHDKILAEGR